MKVFHWINDKPNFGDDINLFLWHHFMPEVVERDDGALLVGIGTVLSDGLPNATTRVVMGSGAGYGHLPGDISRERWKIYGVRGPLTARVLQVNSTLASVDPAVLLPQMDEFLPQRREGRVFVPHWITASDPLWRRAADAAGLEWLDPRQDPKRVIRRLAEADRVVAESMHAAIIADAFGVPWVPVICTHASFFKWRDWTASLETEYRPLPIGPFAQVQALARRFRGEDQPPRRRLDPSPAAGQAPRKASGASAPHGRSARWVLAALNHVPEGLLVRRLASELRSAAARPGSLSERRVLQARQGDLLGRIEHLRNDYARGLLV